MTKSFIKFYILVGVMAVVAACGTPKNIAYLQDVSNEMDIYTAPTTPIRLQPMDQISVIVNGLSSILHRSAPETPCGLAPRSGFAFPHELGSRQGVSRKCGWST